ncbi:MAG: Hsp70 family protein [Gammaproteobacteria bacterium]|nr:Hsp70 family protein [Gammaproteobacteria bacterium]
MGIGIDFGTTNSVAAVYDGAKLTLVPLEGDNPVMPSATYIDADLQTETGQAAINRYITDNTGRTVELIPEVIGAAVMMVGDPDPEHRSPVETITSKVYGQAFKDSGVFNLIFFKYPEKTHMLRLP